MTTNWALVPEELVLHKFDLYVLMMLQLVTRRIVDPDYVVRGMALRAEVLDRQLAHIRAARN